MKDIIRETLEASHISLGQLRKDFTNVRWAPLNGSPFDILFTFRGENYGAYLRGRNQDLVLGASDDANKAIALRCYLDGARELQ